MKNKVRRFRPWEGQWTIAHRILALNLLVLVVFAVSVLYLDAFRTQLQDERTGQIEREAHAWQASRLHVIANRQVAGFYTANGFTVVGETRTELGPVALLMVKPVPMP